MGVSNTNVTNQAGRMDIAIVRVEQVSPFPFDKVAKQIAHYHNAEVGYRTKTKMKAGGDGKGREGKEVVEAKGRCVGSGNGLVVTKYLSKRYMIHA